jgi:selenocysteine-specific elongation factor
MFRKPIDKAIQGDRIGICVTQFDPDKLERGLVCTKTDLFFYLYLNIF